jgi:hypothetical protein
MERGHNQFPISNFTVSNSNSMVSPERYLLGKNVTANPKSS